MTEKQARILIKIGKYFVITLFVIFFVIIVFQSVKISTLTSKKQGLENTLNKKQELNQKYENQIEYIENNFNKFSEEELRKDNYIKENETLVK